MTSITVELFDATILRVMFAKHLRRNLSGSDFYAGFDRIAVSGFAFEPWSGGRVRSRFVASGRLEELS